MNEAVSRETESPAVCVAQYVIVLRFVEGGPGRNLNPTPSTLGYFFQLILPSGDYFRC